MSHPKRAPTLLFRGHLARQSPCRSLCCVPVTTQGGSGGGSGDNSAQHWEAAQTQILHSQSFSLIHRRIPQLWALSQTLGLGGDLARFQQGLNLLPWMQPVLRRALQEYRDLKGEPALPSMESLLIHGLLPVSSRCTNLRCTLSRGSPGSDINLLIL